MHAHYVLLYIMHAQFTSVVFQQVHIAHAVPHCQIVPHCQTAHAVQIADALLYIH